MNKKKLLYMSTHRGCKEMDIILGSFAKNHLDQLTIEELEVYERLLSESDAEIYSGIVNVIYSNPVDDKLKYAAALIKKIVLER